MVCIKSATNNEGMQGGIFNDQLGQFDDGNIYFFNEIKIFVG